MKKIFLYFITAVFFLTGERAFGQIVVDLSTGVFNGTNPPVLIQPGFFDDTWQISQPGTSFPPFPTVYNNLLVSNGVAVTLYGCQAAPCTQNPASRLISPFVNQFGQGEYTDALVGHYFFRMVFTLPHCTNDPTQCPGSGQRIKSAKINFKRIYGDDMLYKMYVNGNPHYDISGMQGYGNNISFSIPPSEIYTNQQNEILINVENFGCASIPGDPYSPAYSPTGLEIEGDLTIYTYGLTDASGNEKSEFCIGEDVYFDGSSLNASSYNVSLYLSGNNNPIVTTQNISGSPNWVNITNLLESAPNNFVFQSSQLYTLKVIANGACGPTELKKDFYYTCCSKSMDASFSLGNNGSVLTAGGIIKGNHTWNVYSTSNIATGPYSPINNYNTPGFSLDLTGSGGSCYFVRHTLQNVCGTFCAEESSCKVACESADCFLQKPVNLNINPKSLNMTWDPVPGATSYVIQVQLNDPACCGGGGLNLLAPTRIPVVTNSHILVPSDLGFSESSQIKCFSWRVFAVCPDGSLSVGSDLKCSN